MPSLPPPIKGELFYDGVWNSASVRTTSDIEITRGLTSESDTAAEPMECTCDLESGSAMLYAPRNPQSPLYGKIGRNTPFRLSLEAGGPYFRGEDTGLYGFSTPDNDAFDFTGDIDLRVDCRPNDWTDPEALTIRYEPGSVTHSFAKGQDGFLYFWWSGAGTDYAKSTGKTLFANGERIVLRVTQTVENADGVWEVRFWWSKSMDADDWTLIGDPIIGDAIGTRPVAVGALNLGDNVLSLLPDSSSGFGRFSGEIYGMQMWDGINDRLVVDLDTARDGGEAAVGGTSLTDATGFTWTRSGTASSFSNLYYRSVGEIPSWPPTRDLTGNAVYTSIAPTGVTRRMDAGNKPIESSLMRFIKASNPDEFWPMTENVPDKGFASSLVGGPDLAYVPDFFVNDLEPPQFGSKDVVFWMEPLTLVKIDNGATFIGSLPGGQGTSGEYVFDLVTTTGGIYQTNDGIQLSDGGAGTDDDPRFEINCRWLGDDDGSNGRWFSCLWTSYTTDASSLGLFFSNTTPSNGDAFFDQTRPHQIRLKVTWSSSSTTLTLYADGVQIASGSVAIGSKPVDRVQIDISNVFFADLDKFDQGVGFATFWRDSADAPAIGDLYDAINGYPGETSSERIIRLANESGYVASSSGDPADESTLSEQEFEKLLQLMQDASDANLGYLLERRDALEIYHRGQSTLWNQSPSLVLDFADGVIGSPFKPVDDDKLTENDVTVSRKRNGTPIRYVLEEGELSVQDFPDGVGRYDNDYEFVVDNDEDVEGIAAMKLHLGTYNGVRYTRITLNLANKRVYAMLHKILRADVGDKIRLLNIPLDHGPGPVDLIIQGYSEVIGEGEWSITFNCTPGNPWSAGQAFTDGDTSSQVWMDTSGCVSGGTADTTQNQIDLFTTAIWHWTSDLEDSPYDIRVGGEDMTVLGPAGPVNNNVLFDTNISSWGTQNGSSIWTDEIVHPHPRARGSLKCTPSGGFSAGGPLSDLSAVGTIEPGVVYAIGAWVYSVNGFSDFRAVADWYDSAGAYISTSGATPVVAPARKWVFVGATPTAPATADRYRIRIRYGAAADADDIYYVWAARLTLARASAVYDTFSRTLADSWGTSETGAAWTNTGGSSTDFDTTGSAGTHTMTSVNLSRYSTTPASHTDQDIRVHVSSSALAAGASQYCGPVARWIDANNSYYARLSFQTNQAVSIVLQKRVGGAQTDLLSVTLPWTHAIGRVFAIRFSVQGSTLRARAWPIATTTEPRIWHAEVEDTSLTAAGSVGVRTILSSGNTNTNPVFSYDEFETVRNQRFSVTRSENGVVKSHVTGEQAMLSVPSYVQM